ncbi:MAG: phospholipase [Azospirillum sp.]|nr:phospholipase [Azospirillum sp.]
MIGRSPQKTLQGPRHLPRSGRPPRHLVVLLHGLGADGNDLIGLAPGWARSLPEAEFLSPHAPFPCDMAPFGRQWFSLKDYNPFRMFDEIRAVAPLLDDFLDQALAERGLGDHQLALVGFSQGTMMALHAAPRRARACAAVLGYSGALLRADQLVQEARVRPPVLLIHGDSDEVVPFEAMAAAELGLREAGIPVQTVGRPGLGHGIDPEGMALGEAFLAQALGTTAD